MTRSITLLMLALASLLATGCSSTPAPRPAAHELRVVTLNLYHDKADWPKREPLIVAGLRELQPDVIALQEVLQHEQLPNQAESLAKALGYRVHFVSVNAADEVRRYGNAILTRHPVLETGSHRLQPLDDSRTVAHARIDTPAGVVDVYATHLHWTVDGGAIRERQLQDLQAYIAATRREAPVIITGDFNAPATAPELAPLQPAFLDAWGQAHPDAGEDDANTTLNPAFFERRSRIDHVFVERDRFDVVDAGRILDTPGADGTWPSDHFGVAAVLRLRP
ncbi:MAG TPA: endonuclease/exonuclease/phosphatase family protein [Luteimonas sp.]|nr:endonuclease/exonuclease/phosphatase family protein [Luteimonas sp.]HRO28006.1 endonuclease/exonuclease/phosphatase family protein [Luteimonas sp.]HRP71019.1 endonuclease/exonuclease/phosphatase family protein [Luteimonas sp.]